MPGRLSPPERTPTLPDSDWIEGDALEGLLPHRGVNLMIDAVRVRGARDSATGDARLCVAQGDARGRDIFLRDGTGGPVLIEPALAEHLALNAICILHPDMGEGEIAFFSTISHFKLERELRAGEPILSEVKRLRDKGRFRRFEGTIRGEDGGVAASAEIMAYTAAPAASSDRRESGKLLSPPEVRDVRAVDRARFGWKRPEMTFIDDRVDISPDKMRATLRYTYPPDHPFCAGHFPGNPVMMGITQWIAAADAAAWLLFERAEAGLGSGGGGWKANVEIIRATGSLIAEIRGLVFAPSPERMWRLGDSASAPVCVLETRRVGFRDQVRPGETIFMRVRLVPEE